MALPLFLHSQRTEKAMRRGVLLLAVGFLMLTISLAVWRTSLPADTAGDVAAIEVALTTPTSQPTPLPPAETSVPTTTTPQPPGAPFTIDEQPATLQRIPVALRIPAISVNAPIRLAGVEPAGDMEVPANASDVGWYKYGPSPGEPGSAVLAAHVDLASQGPGAFFDLRMLEPGDLIFIEFDDGTTQSYRAEARTIYEKQELPTEAIFSRTGAPILTLITCGGGFNPTIGSYDSNVVVYAVPIDQSGSKNQPSRPDSAT